MDDPVARICGLLKVCREEALFYLEGFHWDLPSAIEACSKQTLPPLTFKPSPSYNKPDTPPQPPPLLHPLSIWPRRSPNHRPNLPPPEKREELIAQFNDTTGGRVTRENTVYYLAQFDWSVQRAVDHFFGLSDAPSMQETASFSYPGINIKRSSSSSHFAYLYSSVEALRGDSEEHNLDDLSSMESSQVNTRNSVESNQWQDSPAFQVEVESLESFREVAPEATTEEALKCLTDHRWNVAEAILSYYAKKSNEKDIHGTARPSQVDQNLKGNADDKDASMELYNVPITTQDSMIVGPRSARNTTVFTISLLDDDGYTLIPIEIPFRPDQTVGDIRDALEDFREEKRDYYFVSDNGEVYSDPNITVQTILADGYTTLRQLYF
ncbi:unnamed protein product [Cochlearia groenlandica]